MKFTKKKKSKFSLYKRCKEKWHAPQQRWNEDFSWVNFSQIKGEDNFLILGYIYFIRKDDKPCPSTNLVPTVSNRQCGGFLSFKNMGKTKEKKKKSVGEIADSKRKVLKLLKENGGGNTFTRPCEAQDVLLWGLPEIVLQCMVKINARVLSCSACFSKFMTELQHQCFQHHFSVCINSPPNSAQQVLLCYLVLESCVYFHQI